MRLIIILFIDDVLLGFVFFLGLGWDLGLGIGELYMYEVFGRVLNREYIREV